MKNLMCNMLLLAVCIPMFSQNELLPFNAELFDNFPNVRDIAVSNNSSEIYFTVEGYKKEYSFIAFSKKKDDLWSSPSVVSFSGKDKDLEPFLSPDNLRLYFASNRNVDVNVSKSDFDIWYVERANISSPWSEPKNIGAPINTDKDEFYPSVGISGNLYYTATIEGNTKGKEDIYISTFENGKYTDPTSLCDAVNSETYEFNAFVSPDEKTLIFSSYRRPGAIGVIDLYISKKDENGKWLPAKNMGSSVNSKTTEFCPFVDFNSSVLYLTSDRSKQETKNKSRLSMDEILKNMKTAPNGLSRIYSVNFDSSLFN